MSGILPDHPSEHIQGIRDEENNIQGLRKYNSKHQMWVYVFATMQSNEDIERDLTQILTQIYVENIQQLVEQIKLTSE